jgi:hypothetical protein
MAVTENKMSDTARFLFEQKIKCVNTIGHVCMSWYVSTVVFYGTILAVVWWNRKDLTDSKIIPWLGVLLTAFFAGVLFYGITFVRYLARLQTEIDGFTTELGYTGFFSNELLTFRRAMKIGTASFGIILSAWLILWIGISLGYWPK